MPVLEFTFASAFLTTRKLNRDPAKLLPGRVSFVFDSTQGGACASQLAITASMANALHVAVIGAAAAA